MIEFFIGVTVGLTLGGLMTAFVIGASRVNHENNIYMEGYIAGQNEKNMADYVKAFNDGRDYEHALSRITE